MSKIEFSNPNERELFHAQESWVPVIVGGIPVTLVCVIACIIVSLSVPVYLPWAVILSIIVIIVSRLPHIIRNLETDCVLTDRRLYLRTGIIDIKDHVVDLKSISDITVDPNVMGRIFDYADVKIQTVAGEEDFDMPEIAHAKELRKRLNIATDAVHDTETR